MKKILVISNTAFSIEKFRLHYLNLAIRYTFEIYTPNIKVINYKKLKNINTFSFNNSNLLSEVFFLFNLIKKKNYQHVIVYSLKYQFLISILKFFIKFKFIAVIAGTGSLMLITSLKFLLKQLYMFIINSSSKTIFINPYDKKDFINKRNFEKCELIPTEGIESIKYKVKNNKKINILFFARIIKQKGILDYINTARILKKKYPQLNFYIAGPIKRFIVGQSKPFNLTKELKNENNIKYLGYINKYEKIYSKMDCLISPSLTEGAGTSVMEALQAGLFVIAYKNHGHQYVLSKTQNIICQQNNVNSLVRSVEKYLTIPKSELIKASNNSYKKIQANFITPIIAKKFIKIIDKEFL